MRKFWTRVEQTLLLSRHDAGATDAEIAAELGRTAHAVQLRRRILTRRLGEGPDLTSRQVAAVLGVGVSTAQAWLRAGLIVGTRSPLRQGVGGEWRVSRGALRAFLADRRHWARWSPEKVGPAWRDVVAEVRPADRLLRVAEVAARLGYGERAIQHWIKSGRLRALRGSGVGGKARAWLVAESDLRKVAA